MRHSMEEPAGLLWAWWRGDPVPELASVPDLTGETTDDVAMLARIVQTSAERLRARLAACQRAYVARLTAIPVAYGWSAGDAAAFGHPPRPFRVPPDSRYLWDCATLPAWRGRGIYPRLLQAIVAHEGADVERFWILHQLAIVASARGIARAGFGTVAEVYALSDGGFGLLPAGPVDRARAGALLLDLPLLARTPTA